MIISWGTNSQLKYITISDNIFVQWAEKGSGNRKKKSSQPQITKSDWGTALLPDIFAAAIIFKFRSLTACGSHCNVSSQLDPNLELFWSPWIILIPLNCCYFHTLRLYIICKKSHFKNTEKTDLRYNDDVLKYCISSSTKV